MSDEIERRIRAARGYLPEPDEDETGRIRAQVLAVAGRRRPGARRVVAIAAVLTVGAFGAGYTVASASRERPKPEPGPKALASVTGPGFVPAAGWDVVATGTTAPPQAPTATAANVPLSPADRSLVGPPQATGRRLGANGILFYAIFYPAAAGGEAPLRALPLRLDDSVAIGSFEGMPRVGKTRRLKAHVGTYDLDVLIFFGAERPAPGVLAAAREELARLVVTPCPAAQPLDDSDLPAAERFLLAWLGSHYPGDPSDLVGARATASLGASMPRRGSARAACGPAVAERTVEVDVTLPKVAKVSASLSQLSYFLSSTADGWTVWQRIH